MIEKFSKRKILCASDWKTEKSINPKWWNKIHKCMVMLGDESNMNCAYGNIGAPVQTTIVWINFV